jgi:hypothetical protein
LLLLAVGLRRQQLQRVHPWRFPVSSICCVFDLRFPASGPAGFTIAG